MGVRNKHRRFLLGILFSVCAFTLLRSLARDTLITAAVVKCCNGGGQDSCTSCDYIVYSAEKETEWFQEVSQYDSRLIEVKDTQQRSIDTLVASVRDSYSTRVSANWNQTASQDGARKRYDILINSYMRSGSSFTGQLLAFRPDIFYWYEPMWNFNSGIYYWGKDYICTGNTGRCGIARDKSLLNMKRMHSTLHHIYSCNFTSLELAVAEKMTPYYSGDIWKPYISCRGAGISVTSCLKRMEDICRNSAHIATKIVRLTVDNIEYVLENLPNVKVIHLIRDPRAIINSRITTTWYNLRESPETNHRQIALDAKDMCMRIQYDLKAGEIIRQKYPDRFAFVMFEDLQTNLRLKSQILYSYFGLNQSVLESKLSNMTGILEEEHTVRKKWGDYTNWWRFQLSFGAVKVIDNVCRNVTKSLGYTVFANESQLHDNSIKAFSFKSDILLENIHRNMLYNFNL